MRLRRLLATLCLLSCVSVWAQAKPKLGPKSGSSKDKVTCASCHLDQTRSQPESQMGQALMLPGTNTVLAPHAKLTFTAGPYTYTVLTHDGKSQYIVSDGTQSITVPIMWALGAQAQTWVLERNGHLYESRVSYYPMISGLGITTGDERLDPKSLEEAIGRPISDDETKLCFGCHSSGAVVDHKISLSTLQPGLTCEHCHVGASAHLAAIVADSDNVPIPKKLGQLSAEDTSTYCGQCHRTWETVVRNHLRGQADVRFQPYRLENSKCFNGVDPRISCVACHNPHEKIVRNDAYYDPKCLACHSPAASAAFTASVHPKVCPVAKSNCSSCHMPKVPLPNGLMKLTDHEIRIVKAGEPYPK